MVNAMRMANLAETEAGGAAEERYDDGKKERTMTRKPRNSTENFKKETAVTEYCRNLKGCNSAGDNERHTRKLTHGHTFWWFVLRRCKYD